MWTWWVSRSSSAPVSRSEPKTSVHSSKGKLVVARMEPRSYTPLAGIPEVWLSARGSANRSFQPPRQLRGVGIYRHGCKQGCFQPPPVQPVGASERAAVLDCPHDFGGQGGVAAGADSTPGSLYLSASPAPWAGCRAGSVPGVSPVGPNPPGLGKRGSAPPASISWERRQFLRRVGIVPGQSAPGGITLYPFGFLSPFNMSFIRGEFGDSATSTVIAFSCSLV